MMSEEVVSKYVSVIVDNMIPAYLDSLKDDDDEFIIAIDKEMVNEDIDRVANAIIDKYGKTIYSVHLYNSTELMFYLACKVKNTTDLIDEELANIIMEVRKNNDDRHLPILLCDCTGYLHGVRSIISMPTMDYDPGIKNPDHYKPYLIISGLSAENTVEGIDDLKDINSSDVIVYYDT